MVSASWDGVWFRVGRVNCFIWAPVRVEYNRKDGWHQVGFSFPWSRPKRWRFPEDAPASHSPTIIRGIAFGPFDLRVMRQDKHG